MIIIIIVVITCKSVGTAAIVVSHAINADGAVLAGRRPALVPVRLALTSGVSVYAVARISAALAINQSVVAMVAVLAKKGRIQSFDGPFAFQG